MRILACDGLSGKRGESSWLASDFSRQGFALSCRHRTIDLKRTSRASWLAFVKLAANVSTPCDRDSAGEILNDRLNASAARKKTGRTSAFAAASAPPESAHNAPARSSLPTCSACSRSLFASATRSAGFVLASSVLNSSRTVFSGCSDFRSWKGFEPGCLPPGPRRFRNANIAPRATRRVAIAAFDILLRTA